LKRNNKEEIQKFYDKLFKDESANTEGNEEKKKNN